MNKILFGSILRSPPQEQIFTESGLWIHPEPGVPYRVSVEVWGAGGGGGSGAITSTQATSANHAGGGGGGQPGQYHRVEMIVIEDQAVAVGSPGAGSPGRSITASGVATQTTAGATGSAGGTSYFGLVKAAGGAGGSGGAVNPASPYSGPSGSLSSLFLVDFESQSLGTVVLRPSTNGSVGGSNVYLSGYGGGGGGGTGFKYPGANGATGRTTNGSNYTTPVAASANQLDYGASGAGGAGLRAANMDAGQIINSGGGGNGAPGIVIARFWRFK